MEASLLFAVLIASQAPSVRVDFVRPDNYWSGDRGAGLLVPASSRSSWDDTLRVYADRSTRGAVIALFLLNERGASQWQYTIVARDSIKPHFVEYGYEVLGLPTDAPPANGWVRVILGRDRGGIQRLGWVPLDTAKHAVIIWREFLSRDHGLFFLPPRSPAFFTGPNGRGVRVALRDSTWSSYHLMPDSAVSGDWMRVRIMQPNGCGDVNDRPRLVRVAWIRYIGPGGRPRVFYPTRGC